MLLKNLPFQLLLTIGFAALLGPFLPPAALNFFYTIGNLFKDLLMMFIPFVVCGYLMSAIVSFEKRSLYLVLVVLLIAVTSSFISAVGSYGLSELIVNLVSMDGLQLGAQNCGHSTVCTLWSLPFKSPFTPHHAIIVALGLGFASVFMRSQALQNLGLALRDHSTSVLKKFFIPLLPLYVLAVTLKIQSDGALGLLFTGYGKIFLILYSVGFALLFLGLFLLAGSWKGTTKLLKTFWTPTITAFTTMSGIATMPFLVDAVEKASGSKNYARFTIPLTINIHVFGDALAIIVTALTLLHIQTGALPTFVDFLPFAGFYCMARFFSACVPGGGIITIIPFVKSAYGMAPEVVGLMTALYILQDPLITVLNILGNGIFALAIKPFILDRLKKSAGPAEKLTDTQTDSFSYTKDTPLPKAD